MFKKFALVLAGLMLTVSSVGCCCLGGYGYGSGYRMGCPPCNNGCAPGGGGGYYPPVQTGAVYGGYDSTTTAYSGGITPTAFAPTTTALAPVQGPPIYQNAMVPVNSLPLY